MITGNTIFCCGQPQFFNNLRLRCGPAVGPQVTQAAIDASAHAQCLLVTLTAGVGGSLFAIGSVAGVALMGQARGFYAFGGHLKWSWAIALGYAASIWVHIWLNGS